MKNLHHLIIALLLSFSNLAYSQQAQSDEALSNSDFIFEGTVIDLNFIKDENSNYFVSYILKIETLTKSTNYIAVNDSVELVSPLPDNWRILENGELLTINSEQNLSELKGLHLNLKTRGVFTTKLNSSKNSRNSDLKSFIPYNSNSDCFYQIIPKEKYDETHHKKYLSYSIIGFGNIFESKSEFNDYLKKFQLNEIQTLVSKKKDVGFLETNKKNKNRYLRRIDTAKLYENYLINRLNMSIDEPKEKAIESISYEVVNETVTGTGVKYYEFDIYISGSSSDTYLDNSAFVLEFNAFAFGVNLSLNNLVTITRGSNFSNSTYTDPMSFVTDNGPSSIRFGIGADYNATSWNRTLITTTPQKLLHIKMEISSCAGFSGIEFIDIPNVSIVDLYTITPNIDPVNAPYLAYDNPNYIQPFPYELCPAPVINSFFPMTISSGTESILTINGIGFGNVRGTGQVKFPNSFSGGTTIIDYLNHIDYLSWSDNEIKIVLPYFVDTLLTISYPGSGVFKVQRDDGLTANSPFPVDVKYAIVNNGVGMNGTPAYRKVPSRHVNLAGSIDGRAREFYLDTSITNNSEMAAIIKKSLNDWTCVTTINWVIKDTIKQQGLVSDGKSIIYLDDSYNGSTIGSTLHQDPELCVDALTNEEFIYWKETDIAITRSFGDPNIGWFYDTTMTLGVPTDSYDFYNTVIHELGHAHYLGHINHPNDILYYGVGIGPILAASRNSLYSSLYTIEGGEYVSNISEAINTSDCENISKITPILLNYCGDLKVHESSFISNSILIYPNPFRDEVKLTFDINNNVKFSYFISDLYGKLISEKTTDSLSSGTHTEIIKLPSLSAGTYFVRINLGNETKYAKIIKH